MRWHRAEHQHQVWGMDFNFDVMVDGSMLKVLNVIDIYSHLCLAIQLGRCCKPKDGMEGLDESTSFYPAPICIRSGKGIELTAYALRR